jgi:hypothetical protein
MTKKAMSLEVQNPLEEIYRHKFADEDGEGGDPVFIQAMQNLVSIKPFGEGVPGKEFEAEGAMGFRRETNRLRLTIACEKAVIRNLVLGKFIAMVERMHDPELATIVLENFTEPDEYRVPRGQILGRINPEYSCIMVAQGLTGRLIHTHADLARLDVYYLSRRKLTSFYLAAKEQIGEEDTLNNLIAAFDGWKAFDIPLNPRKPDA